MSPENLWGELTDIDDLRTPLTILREQAALLGEMTNRLLEANVDLNRRGRQITADLDIIVPALDNYLLTIARVRYELIDLYPVELVNVLADGVDVATDEASFVSSLRDILSSAQVRKAIGSLLLQVKQYE